MGNSKTAQLLYPCRRAFPLPPDDAPQMPAYPIVQRLNLPPARSEVEVLIPPPDDRVERFANEAGHVAAPSDVEQFFHPDTEPLQRYFGHRGPDSTEDFLNRKSEELPCPRSRHGTFLAVHLQLETLFDKLGYGLHDPLPGALRCNIDIAVVGVPAEAVRPPFKFVAISLRSIAAGDGSPCLRRCRGRQAECWTKAGRADRPAVFPCP